MTSEAKLLDASAYWRLGSSFLPTARVDEIDDQIARGLVAVSTMLLLETRSGRELPPVDPSEFPLVWITERAERRASDLQLQMRAAHQHLGVPPLDYLIAAVAEAHDRVILHYDADFERLAARTDLAVPVEALAPLGSIP